MGKELAKFQRQIDGLTAEHKQTNRTMIEILEQLKKIAAEISLSDMNSKLIPDEYKDYFSHTLFLEGKLEDGKKAALKDVYIPNSFRILDFPYANEKITYDDLDGFTCDFINGKLNTAKYHTKYSVDASFIRVLFVKGLPGSGKSSLFYYLADKKANDPSFFPKHQFYFTKLIEVYNAANRKLSINNPLQDIEQYIGEKIGVGSRTVIILDGLDEICVAKDLDIQAYCNNLIAAAASKKIKVIITTRLNYINISHAENKNVFNIQLFNLSTKQLATWCENYFTVHPSLSAEKKCAEANIAYMEVHKEDDLVEIFAIPLLFYMIVVSKIDIEKVKSIGELYDTVFEELQNRNYDEAEEDSVQKSQVYKKIPIKTARQIAVEISYKMYSANQLLLKVHSYELQDALDKALLYDYSWQEENKKDIEKLYPMTFFYKDSVDVVEFAHKSIMEFFMAEKLYQEIEKFRDEFDQYIQEYIVNPIIITKEVLDFFAYFASKNGAEKALKEAFPHLAEHFRQMICEKKAFDNTNIAYRFETSIVVLKYYWYFMRNIVHENEEAINRVLDDEIVRKFILGALSVNHSNSVPFLDNAMIAYNFSGLIFYGYVFSYCHLDYCVFDHAVLNECSFVYSDLHHISLQQVEIVGNISVRSCDLTDAILSLKRTRKEKKKNSQGQEEYVTVSLPINGQIIGCCLDGCVIKDMNMYRISFASIISMKDAKVINSAVSLSQLLGFLRFSVALENVELVLSAEDHMSEENKAMMEMKPEGQRNYLKKLIVSRQKDGVLSPDVKTDLVLNRISKISKALYDE